MIKTYIQYKSEIYVDNNAIWDNRVTEVYSRGGGYVDSAPLGPVKSMD